MPARFPVSVLIRCVVAATPILALTGCSDFITYADKTRDAGMVAYNQQDYPKAAGAFRSAQTPSTRRTAAGLSNVASTRPMSSVPCRIGTT